MALPAAQPCPTCTSELVTLKINVDGHDLIMLSCQTCDTRTWELAGQDINLEAALEHVGTHAGRRRRASV